MLFYEGQGLGSQRGYALKGRQTFGWTDRRRWKGSDENLHEPNHGRCPSETRLGHSQQQWGVPKVWVRVWHDENTLFSSLGPLWIQKAPSG